MENKVDLRTPREKARDAEHDRIVNRYLTFKADPNCANVKDNRIMTMIASDPTYSVSTVCRVRQILMKYGVYHAKR